MNNENIKISVVIPNWNGAKTLESTIKSCLNQTLPPFEVIVCDDGSTDNSKEVVKKINDPRLIWLSGEHSGTPAIPRNLGMSLCRGDCVAFCDSDDEWLPEKLGAQYKLMIQQKTRASCTNALKKSSGVITLEKIINFGKNKMSFSNLLIGNNIICSSSLIKIDLIKEVGFFPIEKKYRAYEDYIYWLKISTKTNFSYIDKPLVIYDDHPNTSIRASVKSGEIIKKETLQATVDWLKKSKLYNFILIIKIYKIYNVIKKTLKELVPENFILKISPRLDIILINIKERYSDKKRTANLDKKLENFEVNNWVLSSFIVSKIVPKVGVTPFPLNELQLMTGAVCYIKPTHIFEWGTHFGKSARVFYETVKYFDTGTQIHSIDLPEEIEHNEHPHKTRGVFVKNIKEVKLHLGDGLDTSLSILEKENMKCVPLFFIDGDHSYESVKRELSGIYNKYPQSNFLLHDTFFQSKESGYNTGPHQAICEFLTDKKEFYKVISTNTGLPGMTLLLKI